MPDPGSTIKFLGCSVQSFNTSLGLNGNPSTLSVVLAEDLDANPKDDFLADNHTESDELAASYGGTPFMNGNPGTFVTFSLPDNSFRFTGFVTGYRRTKSTSGSLISLEMSDPRFLLGQIPVINDVNLNINNRNFDVTGWNVFCAPAIFTNPIQLDWSDQGVAFDAILTALADKMFNFYGRNFKVMLHQSFYQQLPGGYRIKQQVGSIEDIISQAAKDAGIDWYVSCDLVLGAAYIIEIRGLKRRNQYNFLGSNGIQSFINDRIDRVASWEIGRELRQEPATTIVMGDRVRTLWNTSPNGTYNIFSELGNGMVIDRPFVSLDFARKLNWQNFPQVQIRLVNNTTTSSVGIGTDLYGNNRIVFPTRVKQQPLRNRKGYIATATVLRAALISKDSWATAVWYQYRDISSGGLKQIPYYVSNSFDLGYGFGAPTDQQTNIFTMDPTGLGIKAPPFDIEKASTNTSTITQQTDIISETVKEAAYQATLRVAQEYYGKKFICRLPTSTICTEIGNQYENNQKKIPIEYQTTDAAPHVSTYSTENFISFPESLLNSDSAGFRNPNGLFKGFAYFNTSPSNGIPSIFNYISTDQFDPRTSIWAATDVSESSGPGSTYFYSGISIEPYRFDPRFAIVTMNEPLLCGVGSYPHMTVNAKTNNKITSWTLTTSYSPINKTDSKGGYLEFVAFILNGFTIVPEGDAGLVINGKKSHINVANKLVSADHYYNLQTQWATFSEQINLAEFRFSDFDSVGGCGFYIPLQWNYIKYGPWVYGTNPQRTVNIVDESKLNPWSYGSFERMNQAGNIIAEKANSSMHTIAYASVTVEGYPEFNLGYELLDSNSATMTNITDLNLGFGSDGVKTTYKFKSYFGPIGFTKRSELDTISYNTFSTSSNRSDSINLNKIWEDIHLQYVKNTGGPNPLGNVFSKNSQSALYSSINASMTQVEVSMRNPQSSRFANQADTQQYKESAEAKLSSIFVPYSTMAPNSARNRVPTIEGGL